MPRASEILADRLRGLILEGSLPPGAPLPSERELASETGLGRSSIREGLRALEAEGLVVTKPGRNGGSYVSRPDSKSVARSLQVFARGRHIPYPTLVEARQVIESGCARLAASRRDEGHLAELWDLQEQMVKAHRNGNIVRFGQLNLQWHTAVARCSHNELLFGITEGLALVMRGASLMEEFFTERKMREGAIRAHKAVIGAIADGDPDSAERAMSDHLHADEREWTERLGGTLLPILEEFDAPGEAS